MEIWPVVVEMLSASRAKAYYSKTLISEFDKLPVCYIYTNNFKCALFVCVVAEMGALDSLPSSVTSDELANP